MNNDFLELNIENIDVKEIMKNIEKKIEEKKKLGILRDKEINEIEDMELLPIPDFLEIPNVYEPHLYKKFNMEEFKPLHIEPEIEEGSGIKGLIKKILKFKRRLFLPLIRFMIRPFVTDLKNMIVELHNKNSKDLHYIKPITSFSKEYIILMHNTINNMIVEMTKLKTDHELLKTKIKILEDKVEFIENRERQIEKKIF